MSANRHSAMVWTALTALTSAALLAARGAGGGDTSVGPFATAPIGGIAANGSVANATDCHDVDANGFDVEAQLGAMASPLSNVLGGNDVQAALGAQLHLAR